MKSAYELAMERLAKESGPSKTLSNEQKAAIQEIEKKYEARIAETRLQFDARVNSAQSAAELEQVRAEMAAALHALEEKRDGEKDAVWNNA